MTVAPVSIANGPSRWPEFKIFVPLVAAAGLVTAAVWFGSKPSVPPPAADASIAIVVSQRDAANDLRHRPVLVEAIGTQMTERITCLQENVIN